MHSFIPFFLLFAVLLSGVPVLFGSGVSSPSSSFSSSFPGISFFKQQLSSASPVSSTLQRPAYAAAPLALNTSQYQFVLDGSIPIKEDFDAVSVDLSYYGLPWNSFLYEEPLPVSWAERLAAMVNAVDAYELPVLLQFSITGNDGHTSCPTANASDIPGTTSPGVSPFTGCDKCFDYDIVRNPVASFIRQGYINYALAVSVAFNATETLALINFGIDANRYLENGCTTDQWVAFSQFTQQVYATLKNYFPDKGLFASFSLESMMQVNSGQQCATGIDWNAKNPPTALVKCAQEGYAALAEIPRDVFAFSAFPALTTASQGGFQSWYLSTPLSFLTAAEKQSMVVASTGFLWTPIVLNYANTTDYSPPLQCNTIYQGTQQASANWFEMLNTQCTNTAAGYRTYVINFKSGRDTLFSQAMTCPCTVPIPALQPYCDVLIGYRTACYNARILPAACEFGIKQYGSMGVRDLFGQPNEPFYTDLQTARQLPLFGV